MSWRVYSDFDNTISLGDVTDAVLERFAAPEWHALEERWKRGEIGSRRCMEQQIALVRATKSEMDALANEIQIDAGFAEFAAFCSDRQIPLTILSDGLDYFIHKILARFDLNFIPVIAGNLTQTGENTWQLTTPNALPLCSSGAVTCKCAAAPSHNDLLYIGDGRSDFCVTSNRATVTLAKTALLEYCQDRQLPHLPFYGFEAATATLENLIADHPKPAIEIKGKIHA